MTSPLSIFDSSIRFRRVCSTRASTRLKSNLAISSPSKSNFGNLCDQRIVLHYPQSFGKELCDVLKPFKKLEKLYNYLSCFIRNLSNFFQIKDIPILPKGGLIKKNPFFKVKVLKVHLASFLYF